jgi:RimJ/RimL family protein N-acetyltransferase
MEPILLDVPAELKTDRLCMRIPRYGDGAMINVAILETSVDLGHWMPWASPTPNVENTEAWCRRASSKFLGREEFHYLLFRKDSNDYIGTCGIHRHEWKTPMFEIGYWLRQSQWGHGYMTEATKAVASVALEVLKANRVEIKCDRENARSRRVAELAGFTLEGIIRNAGRDHREQLRDTCIYALLPSSSTSIEP